MFRGGLVPRIVVTDIREQHKSQIETYERIINLYKDESAVKQRVIDTLAASLDKMAEAQHTTNSLIQSLTSAAEFSKQLAAREPR